MGELSAEADICSTSFMTLFNSLLGKFNARLYAVQIVLFLLQILSFLIPIVDRKRFQNPDNHQYDLAQGIEQVFGQVVVGNKLFSKLPKKLIFTVQTMGCCIPKLLNYSNCQRFEQDIPGHTLSRIGV